RADAADAGRQVNPNRRHLTAPGGRSAKCPLFAPPTKPSPGGIRLASRPRKLSEVRRRRGERKQRAPTVKRVPGLPLRCAREATARPSDGRLRQRAVSSRKATNLH